MCQTPLPGTRLAIVRNSFAANVSVLKGIQKFKFGE